jgi:predicted nucleotide-binding protein
VAVKPLVRVSLVQVVHGLVEQGTRQGRRTRHTNSVGRDGPVDRDFRGSPTNRGTDWQPGESCLEPTAKANGMRTNVNRPVRHRVGSASHSIRLARRCGLCSDVATSPSGRSLSGSSGARARQHVASVTNGAYGSHVTDAPKVFIGAASERDRLASALKGVLEQPPASVVARTWRDVFDETGHGKSTIDVLTEAASAYDFGVFLLSPEDVTSLRDRQVTTSRGNVVLEFGLFLGALGRTRTVAFVPDTYGTELPTDLAGVTMYTWVASDAEANPKSAVRTDGDSLRERIMAIGVKRPSAPPPPAAAGPAVELSLGLPRHEQPDGWRQAAAAALLQPLVLADVLPGDFVVHASYGIGSVLERGPGDDDAYVSVKFAPTTPAVLRLSQLLAARFK